ncbi:unnamed protein product [Ectocarpus sp. 6 AP-2014]
MEASTLAITDASGAAEDAIRHATDQAVKEAVRQVNEQAEERLREAALSAAESSAAEVSARLARQATEAVEASTLAITDASGAAEDAVRHATDQAVIEAARKINEQAEERLRKEALRAAEGVVTKVNQEEERRLRKAALGAANRASRDVAERTARVVAGQLSREAGARAAAAREAVKKVEEEAVDRVNAEAKVSLDQFVVDVGKAAEYFRNDVQATSEEVERVNARGKKALAWGEINLVANVAVRREVHGLKGIINHETQSVVSKGAEWLQSLAGELLRDAAPLISDAVSRGVDIPIKQIKREAKMRYNADHLTILGEVSHKANAKKDEVENSALVVVRTEVQKIARSHDFTGDQGPVIEAARQQLSDAARIAVDNAVKWWSIEVGRIVEKERANYKEKLEDEIAKARGAVTQALAAEQGSTSEGGAVEREAAIRAEIQAVAAVEVEAIIADKLAAAIKDEKRAVVAAVEAKAAVDDVLAGAVEARADMAQAAQAEADAEAATQQRNELEVKLAAAELEAKLATAELDAELTEAFEAAETAQKMRTAEALVTKKVAAAKRKAGKKKAAKRVSAVKRVSEARKAEEMALAALDDSQRRLVEASKAAEADSGGAGTRGVRQAWVDSDAQAKKHEGAAKGLRQAEADLKSFDMPSDAEEEIAGPDFNVFQVSADVVKQEVGYNEEQMAVIEATAAELAAQEARQARSQMLRAVIDGVGEVGDEVSRLGGQVAALYEDAKNETEDFLNYHHGSTVDAFTDPILRFEKHIFHQEGYLAKIKDILSHTENLFGTNLRQFNGSLGTAERDDPVLNRVIHGVHAEIEDMRKQARLVENRLQKDRNRLVDFRTQMSYAVGVHDERVALGEEHDLVAIDETLYGPDVQVNMEHTGLETLVNHNHQKATDAADGFMENARDPGMPSEEDKPADDSEPDLWVNYWAKLENEMLIYMSRQFVHLTVVFRMLQSVDASWRDRTQKSLNLVLGLDADADESVSNEYETSLDEYLENVDHLAPVKEARSRIRVKIEEIRGMYNELRKQTDIAHERRMKYTTEFFAAEARQA